MNNKIKKVLIITPYFPPAGGGLERYAFEIAKRLRNDFQWQIVFVTSGEQNGQNVKDESQGFTVYRLGYSFKISNTPFSFSWFKQAYQILKTENPDIINVHTPVPGLGNIFAWLAKKIPLVVTYHTGSMRKGGLLTDIPIWLYEHGPLKSMLNRANFIVCSSDFVRFNFLPRYLPKSMTITSATDINNFKPDESKKAKEKTVLFVGGLGRAEQHKGLRLLIDAIKKLRETIPDIRLVVVGDGDMKEKYQEYAQQNDLTDNIIFRGKLAGDDLISVYQQAHLFVLPTVNDSFPTVIVEAMACGLPVVSSMVGGIPTIIDEGQTGYLVAAGDINMFVAKIAKLLKDKNLAEEFSQAGRSKAVVEFNWEKRTDRYNELFRRVIENPPLIVHVCAYYPPHIGGLERVAKTAAEFTARAGYKVKVITSDQGINKKILRSEENLTIEPLLSFEFAHTPFTPALFWNLLKLPRHSIIHLHLAQAYFPERVWLAAKLRQIPYIVHFHLDVERSGRLGWLFVIYKKIVWGPVLRSARKVIVCSPDQKEVVEKKFGVRSERIEVVANSVNQKFFSDRIYKPAGEKFNLLYVGRLSKQKCVERLIKMMPLLTMPAQLTIIGDGEDRPKLEALTKNLGLQNVFFLGTKSATDIQAYHRQHDALLISSDREGGTPLVVLEAMAGHLPIIGTNVSGISGLLHGTGVLVDEPYPQGFANALAELWRHPERLQELSQLSADKAKEFAHSNFVHRLIQVYKDIFIKPEKVNKSVSLISQKSFLFFVLGLWWLSFVILAVTGFNHFQILNVVVFLSLLFLPGALTILALPLKGLDMWMYISFAAAFSILELMLIGLFSSIFAHFFGIARPLEKSFLLKEISVLIFLLAIIAWPRIKDMGIKIKNSANKPRNLLFAGISLTFVFLSIAGAIILNNGGSNVVIMLMLAGMAIYATVFFLKIETTDEWVAPTALFFMSLALLLMTSLRGWYITGHDIQSEYKVFELAKGAGIWSIASYRDAYNACLSITILPTIFSNLLKISDPYIYKFLFQIIFAFCTPIVYYISRNWWSRQLSFLAGLYFFAFPTFFEDMPFLIRQEIAFLFYGLMIYIIFKKDIDITLRRMLFMILGVGVIVSHYSTTYTILVIFGLSALLMPIFVKLFKPLRKKIFSNFPDLNILPSSQAKINLAMVVGLLLLSFFWTTVVTSTGGNVTKVAKETITAARNGLTENSRSLDAISFFTFNKPDQSQQLAGYIGEIVQPVRNSAPPGEYFDERLYTNYFVNILSEEKLPPAPLGKLFLRFGINTSVVVPFLGQLLAKLMEIIAPFGVLYVLLKKANRRYIDLEFCLLALCCLLFVALNVVLPVLSTEYGVFRALQQSMFFLAPFIVGGIVAIGMMLARIILYFRKIITTKSLPMILPHNENNMFPVILAVCFFLYSTALVPQLFGGNSPQLHLNNTGSYYDNYLMQASEISGINWLKNEFRNHFIAYHTDQPELQADKFLKNKIHSISDLGFSGDVFPLLIKQKSYVFLSYANVNQQESSITYNSNLLVYNYTYPLNFLDKNKNLIFNNGGTRVYK